MDDFTEAEQPVFYNVELIREQREAMRRRTVPLIRRAMVVAALVMIAVGALMDPVSWFLIGFGVLELIVGAVVLPRLLLNSSTSGAEIAHGHDGLILVLGPDGVRRTTGEGQGTTHPYAETSMRRMPGGPDLAPLNVELPGERLVLQPKALFPEAPQILARYEQEKQAAG
jgi:hypothetical protein